MSCNKKEMMIDQRMGESESGMSKSFYKPGELLHVPAKKPYDLNIECKAFSSSTWTKQVGFNSGSFLDQ